MGIIHNKFKPFWFNWLPNICIPGTSLWPWKPTFYLKYDALYFTFAWSWSHLTLKILSRTILSSIHSSSLSKNIQAYDGTHFGSENPNHNTPSASWQSLCSSLSRLTKMWTHEGTSSKSYTTHYFCNSRWKLFPS